MTDKDTMRRRIKRQEAEIEKLQRVADASRAMHQAMLKTDHTTRAHALHAEWLALESALEALEPF